MKFLITQLIWPEGLQELEASGEVELEAPQADNPLLAHDRAVLTPHVAGLIEEAQVNTSVLVAREVTKVLRGQPSPCVVG